MLMPKLWTVSPISEAEWPCYRRLDTMSLLLLSLLSLLHYSDWVCTAVMSNDVMKDLRG